MNLSCGRSLALAVVVGSLWAAECLAVDIAGRVLEDHSGEPLSSARVRVLRAGQAGLVADLDTDSEGRFRAADLPDGDYRFEISKPNYGSMALSALHAENTLVRLVKLGVITGQVLDGQHRPIRGAFVFARLKTISGTAPATWKTQITDARGEYRLHGLYPGIYTVAASLAGFRSGVGVGAMAYPGNANPEEFTISGGEEHHGVDFVFSAASLYSISGRVALPDAGGTYSVALVSLDEPTLTVSTGETAPDGTFRFVGVPPGSYHLFASGPVWGHGARAALLKEGSRYGRMQLDVARNLEGVSIEVTPGLSVGFVLASEEPLPSGACPASAMLQLLPLEDRAARIMQGIRVNFQEERRMEGLATGRYRVAVSELGERCFLEENPVLDLESERSPEVVRVLVTPAGSIDGRLLVAPASISDYAIVLVASASSPGPMAQAVRVAFPDTGGGFRFDDLRPGAYRIAARSSDKSTTRWLPDLSRMVEIEVPGGAPTKVELPVTAK